MRKTKHGKINGAIMINVDQLQEKLNCGHQTAVKIGKAARARIYVGRRVWYNVSKIEKYLEKTSI